MKFLLPHKFWMATLVLAIALIFFSAPLLGFLRGEASRHLAHIEAAQTQTRQEIQRLDGDIAATKRLSGQIAADEVEKSLAPVDRLKAVDMLQAQASAAHLDHFAYTLSPEKGITVDGPGAGVQNLAVSTIEVKADAPLDTDAYAFVRQIRAALPGRLRLETLTLERTGAEGAPVSADNVRVSADFEWLSNGAASQMAEGK